MSSGSAVVLISACGYLVDDKTHNIDWGYWQKVLDIKASALFLKLKIKLLIMGIWWNICMNAYIEINK